MKKQKVIIFFFLICFRPNIFASSSSGGKALGQREKAAVDCLAFLAVKGARAHPTQKKQKRQKDQGSQEKQGPQKAQKRQKRDHRGHRGHRGYRHQRLTPNYTGAKGRAVEACILVIHNSGKLSPLFKKKSKKRGGPKIPAIAAQIFGVNGRTVRREVGHLKKYGSKLPTHTVSAYIGVEAYPGPFSGDFDLMEYYGDLVRKVKLGMLKEVEDFSRKLPSLGKEDDFEVSAINGTYTPYKKMLLFIASDMNRWKSWFLELSPKAPALSTDVCSYIETSCSLPIVTMQFFNSFGSKYVAKCKDLCRKSKREAHLNKAIINGSTSRWRSEAHQFREIWRKRVVAKLPQCTPLDLTYKKKLPYELPYSPWSLAFVKKFLVPGASIEDQKRRLEEIVLCFVPTWEGQVEARFQVVKVLVAATRSFSSES